MSSTERPHGISHLTMEFNGREVNLEMFSFFVESNEQQNLKSPKPVKAPRNQSLGK